MSVSVVEAPAGAPADVLLAELEAHDCDGYCTPYELGSGAQSRKCAVAASLRILLVRVASKHGLKVIPARLRLWVVGPNQRRWTAKSGWKYTDGPNGIFWLERDRASGTAGI